MGMKSILRLYQHDEREHGILVLQAGDNDKEFDKKYQ